MLLRSLGAIILMSITAIPAHAETDTLSCDTARAIHVAYQIFTQPRPSVILLPFADVETAGAFCLLKDKISSVAAAGADFSISWTSPTPTQIEIALSIYIDAPFFDLSGFTDQKPATDAGLPRFTKMIPDLARGRTFHIPLRERRAYSPARDGHWQYVPLQYDYWGELNLRIGNPDIGIAEKKGEL